MISSDWKFDFSSLPHWDNRDRIPYVHDEFYEIPQCDALCCIYSIAEVSMCNYLGFLAILTNHTKPELLVNVPNGFHLRPNHFCVSSDGEVILLLASMYDKRDHTLLEPILIIDILQKRFSYYLTDNCNPGYKVVETDKGVFRFEADPYQKQWDKRLAALEEKEIRVDRLKWYALSDLHRLPKLVFKKPGIWFRLFSKFRSL